MSSSPLDSNHWDYARPTPHIRLNSSSDNILDHPNYQPSLSSRSLTRGRRRPTSIKSHVLYRTRVANSSSERLLPPPPAVRNRDEETSPFQLPISDDESKRSTWSSDPPDWGSSSPTAVMTRSPFDDPTSLMDDINTQTVAEKYNISPSHGLLIYPEDIEKDDWLHNPDTNDKDFDNNCQFWNSRGIANSAGLLLIVVGILTFFIGYPVL
jgi:hypothetical protein